MRQFSLHSLLLMSLIVPWDCATGRSLFCHMGYDPNVFGLRFTSSQGAPNFKSFVILPVSHLRMIACTYLHLEVCLTN